MPFTVEIIFVLFVGLALGSFATSLCWRIPRDISWWAGTKNHKKADKKEAEKHCARSLCPCCRNLLKPRDLVPLFSWILLKGKCRFCAHSIPVRYPLIEFFTMLGCLGLYLVWGFTVPTFIMMAAIPLLVALLIIDLDYMILPNQLVFLLAALAVIFIIYQSVLYGFDAEFSWTVLFERLSLKALGAVSFSLLVWFVGYVMGIVLKKEALGMGDVKFFAVAGLWLGGAYLPFFLIFSGLCGIVLGGYYQFFLKKKLFPFGPALILSLYTGLVLQGLAIIPFIEVQ